MTNLSLGALQIQKSSHFLTGTPRDCSGGCLSRFLGLAFTSLRHQDLILMSQWLTQTFVPVLLMEQLNLFQRRVFSQGPNPLPLLFLPFPSPSIYTSLQKTWNPALKSEAPFLRGSPSTCHQEWNYIGIGWLQKFPVMTLAGK